MTTEQRAAAILLDKGIKVPVAAPLLFRLFGKRTLNLVIRPPYLGTLYRISWIMLKCRVNEKALENLDEVTGTALFARYTYPMAKVVAYAALNGKWSGRLFGSLLARWLVWHMEPTMQRTAVNVLIILSRTADFTNTIRSAAKLKMTAPNLSQTDQGS